MQRIPGRIKKRERVKFKSLLIKKSHHHSSTFSLSTASNQFYHHYICLSRTECICSSTHQLIFHSLTQMEFNLEYPFANFQHLVLDDDAEILPSLFLIESDHMPTQDYFNSLKASSSDFSLRQQTISSIFHVCNYKFLSISICRPVLISSSFLFSVFSSVTSIRFYLFLLPITWIGFYQAK